MRSPSLYTVLMFLAFTIEEISAQAPKEQLGKMPVCAQACITMAFAGCKCSLMNFECACACNTFRQFSNTCATNSCSEQFAKPILDTLDGICRTLSAVSSASVSSFTTSSSMTFGTGEPSTSTPMLPSLTQSLFFPEIPTGVSIEKPSGLPKTGDSTRTTSPGISGTLDRPLVATVGLPILSEATNLPNYPPTLTNSPENTFVSKNIIASTSAGTPLTLTGPILPITSIRPQPTHSYCVPGINSNWRSNGTGSGWNHTTSCSGYVNRSQSGDRVTALPWNRTATRTVSSKSSVLLYTTTSGVTNATKAGFSAALYTGGATANWAQGNIIIVSGAIFVLGGIMAP